MVLKIMNYEFCKIPLALMEMKSFSLKNAIFCCAKKATNGSSF